MRHLIHGLFVALVGIVVSTPVFAAEYSIDPAHSSVGFKIRHLAISNVHGGFATFEGSFNFDPQEVDKSSAEAVITVASIDTEQTKRDDHLRSPDFFDAVKFPQMKFKSKKVESAGENEFKVSGDLTIRDVTKPVTLDVIYEGSAKDPSGNEKAGFTATAKLNRKDFGLTWSKVLDTGALVVGDEVTINIEVQGVKKNA